MAQDAPVPTPTASAAPVSAITIETGTADFTVKWKTTSPMKSWIEFGETPGQFQEAYDTRGAEVVDTMHWVSVNDLKSDTMYYFVIVVDSKRYDNGGVPFQVMTHAATWLPFIAH